MAFSNYSNLFQYGLLSESSSSYASVPWATENIGPRRGSLPNVGDGLSIPSQPSTSSDYESSSSVASGESLYFTFKRRRNPCEDRSFLSLDLAESQSLRSLSLSRKDNLDAASQRSRRATATDTPTSVSDPSSFMALFSPPLPPSPLQSPLSAHSIPDPDFSDLLGLPLSPGGTHSPKSVIHQPLPQPPSHATLSPPRPSKPRRELSPMRFAAPSPPPFPLPPVPSHFDSFSMNSVKSSDVISCSSTVSSGYRRAQRVIALKNLEGRGADGAVGRIKPRMSQNFMSMSDDEDEYDGMSLHANINVIVEDAKEGAEPNGMHPRAGDESRSRGLSLSIDGKDWHNLTPRASAWGVLFGGEVDGDIDTEVDKIFGLDTSPRSSSRDSDDSYGSRKTKRSKRSNSPHSSTASLPKKSTVLSQPPAHLHPLSPSASTSSWSTFVPPALPQFESKHTTLSLSTSKPRVRQRTVSDRGASSSHTHVLEARARTKTLSRSRLPMPARLELRLDWAMGNTEAPSFIDMRDENLETESRSDSWRSLFEVSCNA
ncbi:hypothetical protein DFH11DRAFT_1733393 [Phellopilus nigrolimitatus]|nr:hypothetical protein DFH11DRAFT_1733393 [Phellopilus nigrolimitatus]